ncbi:hypothetical protein [Dyadobacter aurulentus]|uniref:hypothetical protein n=1 Tax=Dyadobacter sp. UC 10 TaxID=2605428 RepID=UPI0011F146A2|nr:hypothetical protein [Dyadobacter sp. UC 10]KAA0992780.1 hypothetical protein FXO21_22675 [Dyadobacter sp. UC 10]
MKTEHIIFFIILFLIFRSRKAQVVAGTDTRVMSTNESLLRRDMDEKFAMLEAEIEELKNSPFA